MHSVSYCDPEHRTRSFFLFKDTATTEIYTLSLHDALPIYAERCGLAGDELAKAVREFQRIEAESVRRSEEHTSELQSRGHLVCRLLLEKKKKESMREDWV